jgi:hypothetical protein
LEKKIYKNGDWGLENIKDERRDKEMGNLDQESTLSGKPYHTFPIP